MNALLSAWSWVAIGLVGIVGFFVQLLLFMVTFPFDRRRAIVGRSFRLNGVVSSWLNPFWNFRVEGPLPSPLPRRTVLVCNHESTADPFLISRLPWEMKWLSKSVLFFVPFIGWSMWLAGDVPVRRSRRESGREAIARCALWLKKGMPVMIFPEGTRARDDEMLPFKDGAFRLAIEEQADVLPIAIAGTRKAVPKKDWRFGSSRARVTVGQPISTTGMTLDDLERLKAEARAQIEAMRRRLQAAGLTGAAA